MMAPPSSTRPLASTTAPNARTTTSATTARARTTTASPAHSESSATKATPNGTPATTPARARASLAPSFGATRTTAATTTTKRVSPPNPVAAPARPGHRATASVSSGAPTTAPRVGLAGARNGVLSKSVATTVGAAAGAKKPAEGRKELEDKVSVVLQDISKSRPALTDV